MPVSTASSTAATGPPTTPAAALAAMVGSDAARPRVTCYDDTPGPTAGERVELSGRVLANWVAKAANALVERYDAGPGTRVRLALPALHWRTVYWALAVSAAGAELVVDDGAADVLVSDTDPAADVVVTLAALARAHPVPVHPAAMEEARELATYADAFVGAAGPSGVVEDRGWPGGVRLGLSGEPALGGALADVVAAFAVDGSVVLQRGTGAEAAARRWPVEGVTLVLP